MEQHRQRKIRSRTIRHMRMDRLRTSRHIRVNSHSRMHISRHITDRHRQREQEQDLELPHWFLEFYLFLHLHAAINYILAVLAIIFGIVQMVKNEKKGLAIGGIITAVISIVLGIAVSLYAVNIAEKMQDPDSPFYQYFEEYEQKLEEGKSSF